MRATTYSCLLILLLVGIFPHRGVAQEGAFAFRVRGGWVAPLAEFRSGDGAWQGGSGQGPAFRMGFTFPAPGPFGLYLGFGQTHFECDPEVCPKGKDWISTGFDIALRWVKGEGRVRSWLQGGIHTNRFEGRVFDPTGNGTRLTSDGGAGLEVGGGLLISVGERTSLSPGLRYGWGEAPFPDRATIRLQYVMVDVGVLMGF